MEKRKTKDRVSECIVRNKGKDKEGREVLEFSGDRGECRKVIAALADKKEVVIELSGDEE